MVIFVAYSARGPRRCHSLATLGKGGLQFDQYDDVGNESERDTRKEGGINRRTIRLEAPILGVWPGSYISTVDNHYQSGLRRNTNFTISTFPPALQR